MERNFEIPKMKKSEIIRWYARIRPIVRNNDVPVFLRKLKNEEVTTQSFMWLNRSEDYGQKVDYTKLSVLADVKMLHSWGYYGFFIPHVDEVIRQIPKDMLEKVVAFELVYIPSSTIDFSIFRNEFDAGFHVSVVRLYQEKNDSNKEALPVQVYPDSSCQLPIGMSEKQFQKI